jgi:hypothetical protein
MKINITAIWILMTEVKEKWMECHPACFQWTSFSVNVPHTCMQWIPEINVNRRFAPAVSKLKK